ncbi:three component ABC system middle component [Actinomycetospora chlora]|uniref:three component ABC system middle component n=1 Tax=Actinomycetospora chlora TaxID=663608 RepID=UPI003CD06169
MTSPTRKPSASEALFNPAFMCLLIVRAAAGHISYGDRPIPIPLAQVAVAASLDEGIRLSLTHNIASNLTSWIRSNPGQHARIGRVAPTVVGPFRQGMIFGLHYGHLSLQQGRLATGERRTVVRLTGFSEDMAACQRAARYMGRWLCKSGSPSTVLTLLGVRA